MHKLIITILLSTFLLVAPAYAENSFLYSKPIQTDNSPGYKFVVLDKEVYAHSNQLQDIRIFDETDEEVPYFLDSIRDAATSKEKESFIQSSEEAPFVITQVRNDTVITIEVNHLFAFRLELNTNDMFERNYALYGLNGETKRYLLEGRLANLPLDPSLPIKKDIVWSDTNPVDQLQLVIHNRDDKPINLKSVRISYYLNKLIFKDLGNTHYRLAYGNNAINSPHYDIMDYKTTVKKETLIPATLGAEVSTPPKTQLPESPTNYKLLFNLTISALALLLIIGIGLSLRKKNPK
ncbi:MAG: hypothetical protein VR66_19100 [Peptococcaceae bacterium BRH_c23]|nr:MAG: hypothetical protein VR66_19100 [Peptococcaceae bacterium BRH_c23]KJS89232.1 MAG: hypothetical protein JL57_08290 [Desulfosporosinus sp. BICA1-9]HBW35415.1 hypothetical protein [Desulfosporosinus sp.]